MLKILEIQMEMKTGDSVAWIVWHRRGSIDGWSEVRREKRVKEERRDSLQQQCRAEGKEEEGAQGGALLRGVHHAEEDVAHVLVLDALRRGVQLQRQTVGGVAAGHERHAEHVVERHRPLHGRQRCGGRGAWASLPWWRGRRCRACPRRR